MGAEQIDAANREAKRCIPARPRNAMTAAAPTKPSTRDAASLSEPGSSVRSAVVLKARTCGRHAPVVEVGDRSIAFSTLADGNVA